MIAGILLMALNVGFFLGGGAILAIGILSVVKPELIFQLTSILTDKLGGVFSDLDILSTFDLNTLIQKNAYILIAVGGFLFVIGFLGFCGAWRKSSGLLTAYAYVVLGILCAELALGIYAYMYADKLEAQLVSGLKLSLDTYESGIRLDGNTVKLPTAGQDLTWDAMQLGMSCCGVSGAADWQEAKKWNRSYTVGGMIISAKVPPSCCKMTEGATVKEFNELTLADFADLNNCMAQATAGTYNEMPCYDKVKALVFDNKTLVIAVFAIVLLVEVLAIGCACWMKNKVK